MVEDIRLIKNWDVAHFQDKLLMIFWRYVKDQVTELLVEQPGGALPAKLVTASVELLAAITAMFDAFQLVDTKSMSAELKRKDEERDNQLRGVKQMVAAMLRLAQTDEEQAAAKALQQSIDDWKLDPRKGYTVETPLVTEWLKVVADSAELTHAAEMFGLTEPMRRLGELSEEVDSIILDRNVEYMRKRSLQQRQRRKESEERWKTFVTVLNAAAVMDPDEQRYEHFVRLVNYEMKELRRQMRHTRRKNPRKRN